MLGECTDLLYDIVLQTNISDSWVWRHDIGGGYSVRGAYALLTTRDAVNAAVASDLIWHIQVPLKVSVLAWRLLRN
ncbi:helicase-like protein, partial [Trifolium medium]|nr:helicase-like protein [Trifolium medium]